MIIIKTHKLLTYDPDMFNDIISHVGHIPHHQERGATVHIFVFVTDKRFVGKGKVMGNGCQEHFHTDQEILLYGEKKKSLKTPRFCILNPCNIEFRHAYLYTLHQM